MWFYRTWAWKAEVPRFNSWLPYLLLGELGLIQCLWFSVCHLTSGHHNAIYSYIYCEDLEPSEMPCSMLVLKDAKNKSHWWDRNPGAWDFSDQTELQTSASAVPGARAPIHTVLLFLAACRSTCWLVPLCQWMVVFLIEVVGLNRE